MFAESSSRSACEKKAAAGVEEDDDGDGVSVPDRCNFYDGRRRPDEGSNRPQTSSGSSARKHGDSCGAPAAIILLHRDRYNSSSTVSSVMISIIATTGCLLYYFEV